MSAVPVKQYRGKFTKKNASEHIEVLNDTEILLKSAYHSAKMDTPIKMGQNAIYSWQMSIDTDRSDCDQLDSGDMFGVVSNKCNNIGRCPWGNLVDSYGISGRAPNVWLGTSSNISQTDNKYKTSLKRKDIVTMELNCKTSKLIFKLKNKILYTINLPQRESWYPAVSLTWDTWGWRAKFIKPMHVNNDIEESKQKEITNDLNEEIANLQKENTRLQSENDQINDKLIESAQQISSIQQESKRDKETIKEQQDIIQKLQSKYNILEDENSKLKKENADLNEEYKDCKLELDDIKSKYNKLYRKHNINIKNYKNWDYDTITDWIISLDETYQIYENPLRNELKEEALEGTDLADLDTTDLNRFGIKTFKHKKQILNHIKKLTQPQNDNHHNIKLFNEGNNDTVYIG